MGVVDPEVTRLKLDHELELWRENEKTYRKRGWVLLERVDVHVDVGFLGRLPLVGHEVPVMAACVRIDFTDFDLSPPSVEFIDPMTGEYRAPVVQALVETNEGPRDLMVQSHPDTNRPFFCVPGIRQYHEHPQHSGDPWLLHRNTGEGSLVTICDRIWRAMARNLLGVQLNLQTLPGQVQLQLRMVNAPGDVAQILAQQAAQAAQAAGAAQSGGGAQAGGPPQPIPDAVLAALGLAPPEGQGSPEEKP